jgi:hypothetical protein
MLALPLQMLVTSFPRFPLHTDALVLSIQQGTGHGQIGAAPGLLSCLDAQGQKQWQGAGMLAPEIR